MGKTDRRDCTDARAPRPEGPLHPSPEHTDRGEDLLSDMMCFPLLYSLFGSPPCCLPETSVCLGED